MGHGWLLNNIKARKLSYFGHLKRHDSLERHILEARLEGKRRKGRPTRRWTEDIKKWLPMSPTEAGREAQKRDVFRRMVREATSTQTCQDEWVSENNLIFPFCSSKLKLNLLVSTPFLVPMNLSSSPILIICECVYFLFYVVAFLFSSQFFVFVSIFLFCSVWERGGGLSGLSKLSR